MAAGLRGPTLPARVPVGACLGPNPEIAGELFISLATVKTHVRHILAKPDLRDRAQAIVLAHECGLVAEPAGPGPAGLRR